MYQTLCSAFRSAVHHSFTNAAGKMFFHSLGQFVLILQCKQRYQSFISTNPHGDCQPGSAMISHTSPGKSTVRQSENSPTTQLFERVADYVIFDHQTQTYPVVGAIKSDTDDAEGQNTEQMLGLWRKNQCAMLGFTCNKTCIHPRVLLKHESTLVLYCLPQLLFDCPTTLLHFTEYLVAFTSFVKTVV